MRNFPLKFSQPFQIGALSIQKAIEDEVRGGGAFNVHRKCLAHFGMKDFARHKRKRTHEIAIGKIENKET